MSAQRATRITRPLLITVVVGSLLLLVSPHAAVAEPWVKPGTPADAPAIGAAPASPPVHFPRNPKGLPPQADWGSRDRAARLVHAAAVLRCRPAPGHPDAA